MRLRLLLYDHAMATTLRTTRRGVSTIGVLLMLIGGGIMVAGILFAISAISGLYNGAVADALNQPEGTEAAATAKMMRGAFISALGVPFLVIGRIVTKISRRRVGL